MLAKSWISKCLQSHAEHCGQDNSSGFPLKVIDCASRKLCEIAPGTPYVCLSYVWGNASVAHEISSTLSGRLPKTIEDSIWVTLQLGYSYIWIDRYCIDQQNDAEKHRLIMNMGAVYRGATLTIIAAAGDSPHSGLPGINGTPRRPQYSHTVGTSGQQVIGLELPEYDIQDSVWNTRGWTFQELVLSRRRLIFTRSQIGVTDTLFPSWSWASCKACYNPINDGSFAWEGGLGDFSCEESLQVWIHDESGRSLELDHYVKAWVQKDGILLLPKISIRSWVVSYDARPYQNGNVYDNLALDWGFKRKDFIDSEHKQTPPSDGLAAIYLGSNQLESTDDEESDDEWEDALLLVVEKVDDSTWRRIGVFKCTRKRISHRESTLTWLNRIKREGGWEMRTLCLV
ncbi:unnamed protein product [Alternaria sp. RS040]